MITNTERQTQIMIQTTQTDNGMPRLYEKREKRTFNIIIHNDIECKEEIIQINLICYIGAITLLHKFKPLSDSVWTNIQSS